MHNFIQNWYTPQIRHIFTIFPCFWHSSQGLMYDFASSTILCQQDLSYYILWYVDSVLNRCLCLAFRIVPQSLINIMYDELLMLFLKSNTSFFLIHTVSIYNRKVLAYFPKILFLPLYIMLYFSHSSLLSLNQHVLHLSFVQVIFRK